MTTPTPTTSRPHGPVTFAELTAGLIWPRLLRATGLSLAVSRLCIAFATVLLIAAWSWLIDHAWPIADAPPIAFPVLERFGAAIFGAGAALLHMAPAHAFAMLYQDGWAPLAAAVADHPVRAALWIVPSIAIWALGSGAIARSVAVDVSGDLSLSIRAAVAFTLRRWRSMVFAMLIPVIVAALIAIVLMVGGWITLSLKGVSVIGALLLGPAVLLAFLMVLILAVFVVGHAMLTPAVAVESTDAADAVQRAYAYVLGKPGRLLIYGLILLAQGALAFTLIALLVSQGWAAAQSLLTAWLSDERAAAIFAPGAKGPTAWLVGVWQAVVALLVAAWGLSFWTAAGTLLYLLLRRVNDEQDIREIWMPGMVPGVAGAVAHPAASEAPGSDAAQPSLG